MTIEETISEIAEPIDENNDHSEKGEIELPPIKKCFVIGNGRSIKGIDFKKLDGDTFGLTMAYRYWRKIDWYPTYYINVDHVVLNHHHKDIEAFIEQDKCKGYLLSKSILQVCPNYSSLNIFKCLSKKGPVKIKVRCPHVEHYLAG